MAFLKSMNESLCVSKRIDKSCPSLLLLSVPPRSLLEFNLILSLRSVDGVLSLLLRFEVWNCLEFTLISTFYKLFFVKVIHSSTLNLKLWWLQVLGWFTWIVHDENILLVQVSNPRQSSSNCFAHFLFVSKFFLIFCK